jgi:rubrerythrin|tara:strand:+ start:782 stop:1039 length:258 start_codon:yes stop_codon:yes gene_type:complete
MKITKRQLRRIIKEEISHLREATDMPYKVMSPMSSEPAQFRDLEAAIQTATAWERDGFLSPEGTSPEVLDALDAAAGRNPGGSIG